MTFLYSVFIAIFFSLLKIREVSCCFANLTYTGTFHYSQTQSISTFTWGIITFTSTILGVTGCLKPYDTSSRSGVI